MVHTRQSTVKKKKYILPTNNNLNNINSNNDEVSNLVNGTDSITVVPETQTQIVDVARGPEVSFGAPETPTKDAAGLCGKTAADELEKTPVTEITTGEKSSQETSNITMTPDDICMSRTKSHLYKDFEYEQLNEKESDLQLHKDFKCEQSNEKEDELFSSLNCKITEFLSPSEQKSIVMSLKKLSSSLMSCQKLYSTLAKCSEKKVARMFDQNMHLKNLEQETSEKNLLQGKEIAKLEATVDRLRYQLRQKNAHEANLRRTYLAEKKEWKTSEENKVLKMKEELMKVKSGNTQGKDATKLEFIFLFSFCFDVYLN